MFVSIKLSLIIFLLYFLLGLVLAIISKLLIFALNKVVNIMFPIKENKPSIIKRKLIINLLVASLVFALFTTMFVFIALYLNYGVFRLYMVLASLLGFYITFKILSLKIRLKKNRTKSA